MSVVVSGEDRRRRVGGSCGGYFMCVYMCRIFKKNKFLKVNSGSMLIHVQVGLVL